jgi:hypothetical protein
LLPLRFAFASAVAAAARHYAAISSFFATPHCLIA